MFLAKRKTIALSLGGGGARGYAHIGVIKELEARDYEITAIAGTSMGAVVGTLYAAGKLSEFEKWARKLTALDVLGLMDFSVGKAGAIRAERIISVVDQMLDGISIEELPIPVTVIATDLLENKEVRFQSGPATLALRASVAIPGFITPVMIDGKLVADGGMVNPVPVEPLVSHGARRIVAVDLARGRLKDPFEKEISEHFLARAVKDTVKVSRDVAVDMASKPSSRKLAKQLGVDTRIQQVIKDPVETPLQRIINDVPKTITSSDVMLMSIQTMQQSLTAVEFKKHKPDLIVGVPIDACGALEFHKAKQMIRLGEKLATEALDQAGW
ncbi:MAG TPA: patatin-like phospholipase family protein [Aquiluna sp.]